MSDLFASPSSDKPVFEIGLVMAGAVSAGAYTAGVLDQLLESLESWYAAHDGNPPHEVRLRVVGGASAGGMAASVLTLLHDRRFDPVRPGTPAEARRANWLHRAFVREPDLRHLLGGNDLANPAAPIQSLLDCTLFDLLIQKLCAEPGERVGRRPWFDERLELVLSLTNLSGVPFDVAFSGGGASGHGLTHHADYMHFQLAGPQAERGRKLLDPARLGAGEDPTWNLFKAATLATGAFPVFLKPRLLRAAVGDYRGHNLWFSGGAMEPAFPAGLNDDAAFDFVAVDGGALNNEPFDYVRRALAPTGRMTPHQALLLVDPFPDTSENWHRPAPDTALGTVAGQLLGSLKNQARFKSEELVRVQSGEHRQFLIAPQRRDDLGRVVQPALASAALGGFGGFIKESLREHDYFLGRRNCQWFLKRHLVLRENHPLFEHWGRGELRAAHRVENERVGGALPVIPIVGSAAQDNPWTPWPQVTAEELATVVKRGQARADLLVKRLLQPRDWKFRTLGKLAWWSQRQAAGAALEKTLREGLTRAKLLR